MATFNRNNPFQSDLFERRVVQPYLKEYRQLTSFARFMGRTPSNLIYMIAQNKGEGDTIAFPLRQVLDPVIARGNQQLEGRESELQTVTDRISLDRIRFAVEATDRQMEELRVRCNLEAEIKDNLLSQAEIFLTKRIVSQFALAFSGVVPQINQDFTYAQLSARMLAANLDTANAGMSRSRVVIGNNYLATQATFTAALAIGNLPVAANKMSVQHIRYLVQLATTGQSGVITGAGGVNFISSEAAIPPYKYKLHNGFTDDRYVLFISPNAYFALVTDPEWAAQITRGTIENEDQPSTLYGSRYKGTIEGVMIIVVPELSKLTITNAANNTYAYSAFCGASAIGYGMGQTPKFTMKSSTDYELHYGIAHNEISGMKVLKYPSKSIGTIGNNTNLVEYGMVHSLTTLT